MIALPPETRITPLETSAQPADQQKGTQFIPLFKLSHLHISRSPQENTTQTQRALGGTNTADEKMNKERPAEKVMVHVYHPLTVKRWSC
jgi:hypothetical protein